MKLYTCPVCAYSRMPYPIEEGNICPCCGTEFGYDDMDATYREVRDRWVGAGTPWFSPIDAPPLLWNGIVQLVGAEYEFTPPTWLAATVIQSALERLKGTPAVGFTLSFDAAA